MQAYDVIIIGGGFLGLSSAYQLSKKGVRTLLLEAGDIGGGTSASCAGRAQVCEGHLDPLNLKLIRDGLAKHDGLEEELGETYDWRRIGIFLLIKNEELWKRWEDRSAILTPAGIPTEVVDRIALQKAEPNMNTDGLLGAAHSLEGSLNPLKFSRAYARAAQRFGADIRGNSEVVALEVQNRRVTAVKTKNDTFYGDKVAVMAGAWVPTITRLAGVEVPIRHAHAEALVTERIPAMVFNNIELSDFYETIHGKARAVAVGVHPNLNGSLDVTEAITRTEELHRRVSAWGFTALSKDLVKLYPFLEKVRVVRSWGRPTSFTPDEEPLVGWIPQLDNMYVSTSLVETITTVPLLSEWMAMMIQGQVPPVSMDAYSPSRFINGWTWKE
jgi:glycine/D-amino acid oxidase-like deaminating enzyme